MERGKLVLLDYSGTLSISSVHFGRSDVLVEELKQSGLAACGVATPDIFWNGIVGPTWHEASTTGITYAEAMRGAVRSIAPKVIHDMAIRDAVSRFVESYLLHSQIDPLWRPVLKKLAFEFAGKTVIVTDHYAEATGYIKRYLNDLDIPAEACGDSLSSTPSDESFVIANSANIGAHKLERRFWEILAGWCRPGGVGSILLVDDFGFNEVELDPYGILDAVISRKEKTVRLVEEVYTAPVAVVFFGMEEDGIARREEGRERFRRFAEWVAAAEKTISKFIEK